MLGRSVPSCSGLRPAGQGESSAGRSSDHASLLVLGGPGEEGRLSRESQQLAPAPGVVVGMSQISGFSCEPSRLGLIQPLCRLGRAAFMDPVCEDGPGALGSRGAPDPVVVLRFPGCGGCIFWGGVCTLLGFECLIRAWECPGTWRPSREACPWVSADLK